ncbi:MAG TPA: hypothetical protein VGP46_13780 [Acidimicrobiales bacterium]|jgi:hypothetical protein|nr:hypothetical protein [Acidimicrobiales bacterium]
MTGRLRQWIVLGAAGCLLNLGVAQAAAASLASEPCVPVPAPTPVPLPYPNIAAAASAGSAALSGAAISLAPAGGPAAARLLP